MHDEMAKDIADQNAAEQAREREPDIGVYLGLIDTQQAPLDRVFDRLNVP